jgi:hypothetical protein
MQSIDRIDRYDAMRRQIRDLANHGRHEVIDRPSAGIDS